jgi:predicted flap endonuclease-1-like 5' DNA nuclease
MNKIHLRAFAFGLLLSTCIFGSYYYFSGDHEAAGKVSNKELIAQIEEDGYKVVKAKEYAELEAKVKEAEASPTEETKETEQTTDTAKEEPAKEEEPAVKEYKLTIVSGMQSSEIATMLKDAGILADAFDFEQYLISSGYHTKVQLGEFVVKSDMTYEQLAKIITKS